MISGHMEAPSTEVEVIIPNLNRRFSGITSTVAAVVPHQAKGMKMAAVGYPLPCPIPRLEWGELIRLCRHPLPGGKPRVFHARRNNEMLVGLLLKWLCRCHLHLAFTSTAQRRHSRFTRFLYGRMDSLLSTSPKAASFLVRRPDAIIPHGVDLKIWFPAESRAAAWREGGLPGKYGVGIFGRVRPQKGIREFVEALCEVLPEQPDFTAVVVGQVTPKFRPFVNEMKALIRSKGLADRFCWMGPLPFAEIPGWFRRMSLVVCASHNEGFGLTCLEAMASGVPVVATRAGAWEMLIREGRDGYLVPPADSTALAVALRKALTDAGNLGKMGAAAHGRAREHFSVEKEASSLNRHYKEMINSG